MFRLLREWRHDRIVRDHPIHDTLWRRSVASIPILHGLSGDESDELRRLATLFLYDKVFHPVQGIELTDRMRIRIAAQACLPILNLGFDWYRGWNTVIVYPGRFLRPRTEMDDVGVMHEWVDELSGEAWDRGPVILSWADVAGSGVCEGYNVIIHEMAHKLDMLDGEADGFPPLHRSMRARAWYDAFTPAYEDLQQAYDEDLDAAVDPYAGHSPAECFAVFSEYFFEQPALIADEYPEIYRNLAAFYRQDPLRRMASDEF